MSVRDNVLLLLLKFNSIACRVLRERTINLANKSNQCLAATVLALLIGPFSAPAGASCDALPEAAVTSADALIERSSRIVLVRADAANDSRGRVENDTEPLLDRDRELKKVTEASPPSGDRTMADVRIVTLMVIEDLKGKGAERLYLPSSQFRFPNAQNDFAAHNDDAFWSNNMIGRVGYDDDCRIAINLDAGQTYLVFVGPFHVKGYELVVEKNDRWLSFVRERIGVK